MDLTLAMEKCFFYFTLLETWMNWRKQQANILIYALTLQSKPSRSKYFPTIFLGLRNARSESRRHQQDERTFWQWRWGRGVVWGREGFKIQSEFNRVIRVEEASSYTGIKLMDILMEILRNGFGKSCVWWVNAVIHLNLANYTNICPNYTTTTYNSCFQSVIVTSRLLKREVRCHLL